MPLPPKRKRKRISESEKTPVKKARTATPKTPKSDVKDGSTKKKRRSHREEKEKRRWYVKRRRLRNLRQNVAKLLERALVEAPKIPIIHHLFTDKDSMGTPRAPLHDILRTLKISNYVKNTHFLTEPLLLSLSDFTSIFRIEKEEDRENRLFLKYFPIYEKEKATVYVDNLPEGTSEEMLMRLANCYGTVVTLSISKKGPRWIRPRHHPKKRPPGHPAHRHIHRVPPKKKPLINVGSRPKSYGFIRFVEMDSAEKMIREFKINDPTKFYPENAEKLENLDDSDEFLVPGDMENLEDPIVPNEFSPGKSTSRHSHLSLYMTKLIREIRFLKLRRKRRPWPMFLRLRKLERRLNELRLREWTCLKKAGLLPGRNRVKRRVRVKIAQAVPAVSAGPSTSGRPSTPPPSPNNSESPNSSVPPHPINKTPSKNRRRNKKPRKSSSPRKKCKNSNSNEKFKILHGKMSEKRKKKRKRKKMSRKLGKFIPGGQVRRFFQDVQVLSIQKYLELKEEYKELVRAEKERVREEMMAPPAPE